MGVQIPGANTYHELTPLRHHRELTVATIRSRERMVARVMATIRSRERMVAIALIVVSRALPCLGHVTKVGVRALFCASWRYTLLHHACMEFPTPHPAPLVAVTTAGVMQHKQRMLAQLS